MTLGAILEVTLGWHTEDITEDPKWLLCNVDININRIVHFLQVLRILQHAWVEWEINDLLVIIWTNNLIKFWSSTRKPFFPLSRFWLDRFTITVLIILSLRAIFSSSSFIRKIFSWTLYLDELEMLEKNIVVMLRKRIDSFCDRCVFKPVAALPGPVGTFLFFGITL